MQFGTVSLIAVNGQNLKTKSSHLATLLPHIVLHLRLSDIRALRISRELLRRQGSTFGKINLKTF